ncbi:helix-turn-helix domain-containing protein [Nitratifractor sp.]
MATEQLIGESEALRQIVRGLQLTHSLFVSSIIVGPPATGKRTLVRLLLPDTSEVNGADDEALKSALAVENELIILNFESVKNPEHLDFQNKRIIALANREIHPRVMDEKFAFIYRLPPLKDRPEDIDAFLAHFLSEAKEIFGYDGSIDLEPSRLDLSQNLRSLKASVYRELLLQNMEAEEIEYALYHFFSKNLEGNNAYREHLRILERPMLQAGLQRYGSQLKLSEILGINRNTLRKKLHEYRID